MYRRQLNARADLPQTYAFTTTINVPGVNSMMAAAMRTARCGNRRLRGCHVIPVQFQYKSPRLVNDTPILFSDSQIEQLLQLLLSLFLPPHVRTPLTRVEFAGESKGRGEFIAPNEQSLRAALSRL
jgi:hypothetical protein